MRVDPLDAAALGLFALDLVLDGLTTKVVFRLGEERLGGGEGARLHLERNPIARRVMARLGVDRMLVASRVAGLLLGAALLALGAGRTLLAIAAGYALVPVWNLTVVLHYLEEPDLLRTRVPAAAHVRWCAARALGR